MHAVATLTDTTTGRAAVGVWRTLYALRRHSQRAADRSGHTIRAEILPADADTDERTARRIARRGAGAGAVETFRPRRARTDEATR